MSDRVTVISSDVDGLALRRKKAANSRYLRCDGKTDNEEIQLALDGSGVRVFSLGAAWERIFGKGK